MSTHCYLTDSGFAFVLYTEDEIVMLYDLESHVAPIVTVPESDGLHGEFITSMKAQTVLDGDGDFVVSFDGTVVPSDCMTLVRVWAWQTLADSKVS